MEAKKRYLLVGLVALVAVAADQATKIWARSVLRSPEARRMRSVGRDGKRDAIRIIPHRVEFRLSFNRGVAFGIFNDEEGSARWWLVLVGLAALGLVAYMIHRPEGESRLFLVALGLVSGGAVGNLIDRVLYGKVTDFVQVWLFRSIKITWPWPAFNVADAVLVIGVGLIVLQMILESVAGLKHAE